MIHVANSTFDFGKVSLSTPVATQTGGFYSKINFSNADDSLYVFTPKSVAKTGVVETSCGKKFVELTFAPTNSVQFMEWAAALEERLVNLVYEKRALWFTDEMELDEIQSNFFPLLKSSKGGNITMRAYAQQGRSRIPTLPQVFDSVKSV